MGIGNAAAWLGMPVIAPETFESIASKLENQDHAAQLPPYTDPTVIAGEFFRYTQKERSCVCNTTNTGYSAQMKEMARSIRSSNTAF